MPGAQVSAGDVVLEMNGQPIFALPGEFPLYRDLHLGDKGPDVTAVQEGLIATGYRLVADGRLGAQTQAAISRMFTAGGYAMEVGTAKAATPPPEKGTDTSNEEAKPEGQGGESETPPEPSVLLPMDSVVVAPLLPAIVSASPGVGRVADDGAVISFSAGDLRFVASVTTATAAQMSPGMGGVLSVAGAAEPLALSLQEIDSVPKEDGTVDVIFVPTGGAIPTEMLGLEVVAEVRLDPGIEESLVVPTRGVIIRGDNAYVRVLRVNGETQEVAVTEVASSLGRSAVRPIIDGALDVGDDVVLR